MPENTKYGRLDNHRRLMYAAYAKEVAMGPERKGGKVTFTIPEAAEVLGITRQAVYAAISAGQLKATEEGYGKKIEVEDLLGYGIRTGRDPNELITRIKEGTGASMSDLLLWVLAGLGGVYLFKKFLGE